MNYIILVVQYLSIIKVPFFVTLFHLRHVGRKILD